MCTQGTQRAKMCKKHLLKKIFLSRTKKDKEELITVLRGVLYNICEWHLLVTKTAVAASRLLEYKQMKIGCLICF
jgi:hypothetical protein